MTCRMILRWTPLRFVVAVLALVAVGVGTFVLSGDQTKTSVTDWPPLTMTYPSEWYKGGRTMTTTYRLTYNSRTSWIQEVIAAEPIETHVGTFSDVGSYRELENGRYTTYHAVTESTEVEEVPDDILMIPRGGLHPHSIRFLEDLFGKELTAVSTETRVCFYDVCTDNAPGWEFREGNMVFADDARGIPVKMGRLVVTEVRVQGEREPVR